MKCSFAKMSTKGTFEPIWPYGTDLYGRFLYLESGTEQALREITRKITMKIQPFFSISLPSQSYVPLM